MAARLRIRLATGAAAAVFVLAGGVQEASAQVELSNDVGIVWSQTLGNCKSRSDTPCSDRVIGAPRLVSGSWPTVTVSFEDPNGAGSGGFELIIDAHAFGTSDFGGSAASGDTLLLEGVPLRATFECPSLRAFFDVFQDGEAILDLNQTPSQSYGECTAAGFGVGFHLDRVITVSGFINASTNDSRSLPTITLSGVGQEIRFSRIGDVDDGRSGDSRDIATRSMQMVRALSNIESLPGNNQGAELDVLREPGRNPHHPVGFTHTFDVPDNAHIDGAVLTLHVGSESPFFTSDFILLDRAVRNAAARRTGVPAVVVGHLLPPHAAEAAAHTLVIDLAHVPVVLSYPQPGSPFPAQPDTYLNLLSDLKNGQLNVIMVDRTNVDFSDVIVMLKDR